MFIVKKNYFYQLSVLASTANVVAMRDGPVFSAGEGEGLHLSAWGRTCQGSSPSPEWAQLLSFRWHRYSFIQQIVI